MVLLNVNLCTFETPKKSAMYFGRLEGAVLQHRYNNAQVLGATFKRHKICLVCDCEMRVGW